MSSEGDTHVLRNKGDRVTPCGKLVRLVTTIIRDEPTCPVCKKAYQGVMRRYWNAKGRYKAYRP